MSSIQHTALFPAIFPHHATPSTTAFPDAEPGLLEQLGGQVARVAQRRDLWVPLAFFAIGFVPISCLALAVFEILPLHVSAPLFAVPAAFVAIALSLLLPRYGRLAAKGYALALIAVLAYDATRLPFVLTGLWHDFIPNIGAFLLHRQQGHAALGYAWRWLGNGGGLGLAFFMAYPLVAPRIEVRKAALIFGVSVWACLMATLLIAPHGEELLFRLTPKTFCFSLLGHVVFGGTLGALMRHTRPNVQPYAVDEAVPFMGLPRAA